MRSALLLLSLIATAFATTCYYGLGTSSSHPTASAPCVGINTQYCLTTTLPNGTTIYGCDGGYCQSNSLSSGQCKTSNQIKYCCCSGTLCNSGKPTGYSYILAVIAVSVSFVFA